MTETEKLRAALKWALENGANVTKGGSGFDDKGCGCCSGSLDPPAEFDAIVREIRRKILDERNS